MHLSNPQNILNSSILYLLTGISVIMSGTIGLLEWVLGISIVEILMPQYITTEFGTVMSTVLFVLLGVLVIRKALNEAEQKKIVAEQTTLELNKRIEEMVLHQSPDIQYSHELFVKLFESNPTGIAISKLDTGEYINVNQAVLDMFKYTHEEMIGHTPTELLILDIPTRQKLISLVNEEGRILNTDITLRNKEGMPRHCIFSMEKLIMGDEQYLMSFIYDITDRKIIENNLVEAHQKLEILTRTLTKQNQQLRAFAHITSHNLRAPVSNLNLLLRFYKESTTIEDKDELVGSLDTVVDNLTVTLDELLETVSVQEDTTKERIELSFEDIFTSVKAMLNDQLMESKAIVNTDFSKAPIIIYPRVYLESILFNLLSNALKYSSPDRVPEIRLTTENNKGEIILKVQDNGLGIDLLKHRRNIFGMHKTFHRHKQARGMGLFMIKTQVEAMGGEITVESVVNEGSIFTVIFNSTAQ